MTQLVPFLLTHAWAASAGSLHGPSIVNLVFPVINFLIFAYLLKRFLLPTIKPHLRSRREELSMP